MPNFDKNYEIFSRIFGDCHMTQGIHVTRLCIQIEVIDILNSPPPPPPGKNPPTEVESKAINTLDMESEI